VENVFLCLHQIQNELSYAQWVWTRYAYFISKETLISVGMYRMRT